MTNLSWDNPAFNFEFCGSSWFQSYIKKAVYSKFNQYDYNLILYSLWFFTDYKFESSGTFSFTVAPLHKLTWGAVFAGLGLGFSLSLLFFMDQNISSAMVNNPGNRYITLIIFFKEGLLRDSVLCLVLCLFHGSLFSPPLW